MDKPKCRVCGHKHWSGEEHVFEETKANGTGTSVAEAERGKLDSVRGERGDNAGDDRTGQVARNQRWREKNREKYNAYMRRYRRENPNREKP